MNDRARQISAPLARWSSRIAIFSASLVVVGLLLHRLTSFPTPVALNLFVVAFAGAALALLIGLIALAQIWHTGYAGAGSAAIGILLPLMMGIWPLAYLQAYRNTPALNDVTTDVTSPPRFAALAKQRVETNNGPVYPATRFGELQQKSYPDLRTLVIERPVEEAFELVEETAARLKWKVVAADAPAGKTAKPGSLEAIDQTMIMGFTDDVVVRVEGNVNRSRIDVRSASRYGVVDFGQNATRVRRFLAELKARSETTSPQIAGRRGLRSTRTGAMAKRAKDKLPEKAGSRTERDRAQSSAQRARGQKETPR
jgi:hypothetical protein